MIHLEKPESFNSIFEIVSCFFEHDGHILLLHRQDTKPQGNTWGVPAGKVEQGEGALEAMVREIEEETGYTDANSSPTLSSTVFVRYPDYDFIYHIFHLPLSERPVVIIDTASHKNFQWETPCRALEMDLIPDLDACIKLHYGLE
jgi:8-oxo-dGTP pyrophosphatase MutT (NUDIX family)